MCPSRYARRRRVSRIRVDWIEWLLRAAAKPRFTALAGCGMALGIWISQAIAWPMSFVAPVLTMFILALPQPAMNLGGGVRFILVFIASLCAGLAFMPFLVSQRMVGFLLLSLALFHTFYYTARGGSPVLGSFATIGLTIVISIGSVSIDALLAVTGGLAVGAVAGVLFVWVAHAILPDSLASPVAAAARGKPQAAVQDPATARRSAWRALLVMLPVVLWFILSSASTSYVGFMITRARWADPCSRLP